MEETDVIIVGAGPVGLTCAIECKKRGLNHLILEEGMLVNSLFHFPTNMTFFSTSQKLEIGGVPFISHTEKPTRREALEYYRRVCSSWELNLLTYHKVDSIQRKNSQFEIQAKKKKFRSKYVIISTGFYGKPRLLDIPGEELDKVFHYYTEVHPFIGQKVAVIGSANSACDVALELFHKDAEVTMIIRQPSISERVKYWIKPNIENRINEGSIKAYFNSNVKEIHEDQLDIITPDGEISIKNDFVLAMTGYRPDFDFLQQLGIQLSEDEIKKPVHDPATLETNVKGMYVAGVINAGLQTSKIFIENSMDHATKIFDHIMASEPVNI
ncbi:MAG: YpdA family putative bacillithiol disulfide reductase [Bacteroidia bacterium]|nr:YpdA family putative bacillithiol disulfide reductase [Bacteroidia bacterium]